MLCHPKYFRFCRLSAQHCKCWKNNCLVSGENCIITYVTANLNVFQTVSVLKTILSQVKEFCVEALSWEIYLFSCHHSNTEQEKIWVENMPIFALLHNVQVEHGNVHVYCVMSRLTVLQCSSFFSFSKASLIYLHVM